LHPGVTDRGYLEVLIGGHRRVASVKPCLHRPVAVAGHIVDVTNAVAPSFEQQRRRAIATDHRRERRKRRQRFLREPRGEFRELALLLEHHHVPMRAL